MINTRVLFIGNFLSFQRGTIGPMEGVMNRMQANILIAKASSYDNKLIKLIDIFIKSLTFSYDTIHIDTYSTSAIYFSYFAASIGKMRKKKVILNLRGGGLYELFDSSEQKKQFISRLFSKATVIVTPSLYLQDKFRREGFSIDYLPNTVDGSRFPFQKKVVKNHKLLWVRAFNATYQPWLAVKTLWEVRKQYPDATLTMIGPDKGLLTETQKLIDELDLNDCIKITGKIPNTELSKYYSTHSVYLNTTSKESFGVAVMEAASCGIPIVTTSVGELSYLWQHEQNAMIITSFDPQSFAGAISYLWEDRKLYEKLKSNAFNKAQSFDWEVVEVKWVDLFNY